MKKMVSFIALLMAVLLLAACSGQSAAPAAEEADAPVAEEAASSEEAVATGEDDIVIQHWYHQYGEEGTYEAALRYAEEYSEATPGVSVEVTWVPGDYAAALNAALLTDEGPDVFELQTADIARVNAGQLEPLDALFEGVQDDFDATALSRVIVDGTIYGVPMIVDPQLVFYSKSALEEAGVEVPTTMDELIAAAAALDTGRVKGLFLGNDLGSTSYLLYMSTFASDTTMLDGDQVAFNTDTNALMWEKKQELAESGNLLVGATTEWWDPSALIDGLASMQYIGLWATPAMTEAFGDDLGVMAWPAADENSEPAVFIGGWNQSVNANSANKQAAMDYVKWLWIDNTEVQQDWSLSYGFHVPPRKSAAATADALTSGAAAEVLELMDAYGATPSVLWTGAMDSAYIDAHSEVLLNGADPAEMLSQAETAVQSELDSLLSE